YMIPGWKDTEEEGFNPGEFFVEGNFIIIEGQKEFAYSGGGDDLWGLGRISCAEEGEFWYNYVDSYGDAGTLYFKRQ
ncbi:hypothetical protein, partial [Xanthovirga aplysinae]|uniref:hypothetical protein n=1 Tax=Xanthovirga aplysinae TaxID=2529853 RepID=UPI001656F40A